MPRRAGRRRGIQRRRPCCPHRCETPSHECAGVPLVKRILFKANNGTNGPGLWATDGTLAGTQLILDLREGNDDAAVSGFFAFRNKVLFTYDDGVHGTELWITDGTPAGTSLLLDI